MLTKSSLNSSVFCLASCEVVGKPNARRCHANRAGLRPNQARHMYIAMQMVWVNNSYIQNSSFKLKIRIRKLKISKTFSAWHPIIKKSFIT